MQKETVTPCQFIKKNFPHILEEMRMAGRKKEYLTPSQIARMAATWNIPESKIISDEPIASEVCVTFYEDARKQIYPSAICYGIPGCVSALGSWDDRIIGTIHTHPQRGILYPSAQDLYIEVVQLPSDWFGIISTITRNMIFLWNFDRIRKKLRDVGNAWEYLHTFEGKDMHTLKEWGVRICGGKY